MNDYRTMLRDNGEFVETAESSGEIHAKQPDESRKVHAYANLSVARKVRFPGIAFQSPRSCTHAARHGDNIVASRKREFARSE